MVTACRRVRLSCSGEDFDVRVRPAAIPSSFCWKLRVAARPGAHTATALTVGGVGIRVAGSSTAGPGSGVAGASGIQDRLTLGLPAQHELACGLAVSDRVQGVAGLRERVDLDGRIGQRSGSPQPEQPGP